MSTKLIETRTRQRNAIENGIHECFGHLRSLGLDSTHHTPEMETARLAMWSAYHSLSAEIERLEAQRK